ncbi:MAG: hypothetical protein GC165_19615 [Armatimonadetes bacterium]|nr:hypothetical protein [Armatimonadota bacterium]
MQENNALQSAFPASDPTDLTRSDVLNQANRIHGQHLRQRRNRSVVLGGIATVAIGSFAVSVGPKAYAYYQFQKIAGASSDCKTAVMKSYDIKSDGTTQLRSTTYFENGKWRIEDDGKVTIFADHILWKLDPALQKATKKRADGPFAYTPSGFSIGALASDHQRWHWSGQKISFGSETYQGQPVDVVTMEQTTFPTQSKFFASKNDHRIFRVEVRTLKNGTWILGGFETISYDQPLPAKTFAVDFPKETQVIDVDHIADDWKKKLEKPIATLKSEHGQIVIRDYYVNSRGHVFIVFTDGETKAEVRNEALQMRQSSPPKTWHALPTVSARDSELIGYEQSPASFQPFVGSAVPNLERGIVLSDGEILQGAWLVPARITPWKPKQLDVQFLINWPGRDSERTNTWTIQLDHKGDSLRPDWMVACAIGPINDEAVLRAEQRQAVLPAKR